MKKFLVLGAAFFILLHVEGQTNWPRQIQTPRETITIYSPQPVELQDGILSARAALSVQCTPQTPATHGVMRLEARALTDAVTRRVYLKDLHLQTLHIPSLDRDRELRYSTLLTRELSTWNLEFTQDTLNALLDLAAATDAPQKAEASLPHTATISRNTSLQVQYHGAPLFEPIAQTSLRYATNTDFQVLQDDSLFYCADRGIWFCASQPTGPWSPTDRIPAEVLQIPPSHPMYNTRFLYASNPSETAIDFGFYPGYLEGRSRWNRFHGWGLDYQTPDYSISVGTSGGLYYREKSTVSPRKREKNWGRDTSKFPEFDRTP